MLLHQYLEKHMVDHRKFAYQLGITHEHLRMIVLGRSYPSRKLGVRIGVLTNGEVTKYEALFPEDSQ